MTFVSIEYLFFLPLVVVFYFLLPQKIRWGLLLISSYLFYAYWSASFLILIIASTLVDYWAGIQMDKFNLLKHKKIYLYISLVVNLGMLFSFKYLGFANEIVRETLSLFGASYPIRKLDILLPVGISFYTFQTLSYTIDVYRGDRKAESHLGMFALYVSFFPQLVAGPIERSTRLLPQLYKKQSFKWENISSGFRLIIWGAFKKIIIADYAYLFLTNVFDHPELYSGLTYVIAAFGSALWIYADFSGYTDMAIGSAKLFGIDLIPNFKRPYLSRSISELWQRWHISLTNWIGHYIHRPLMRKSKNKWQSYFIIIVVFLTIGAWHGANWTFIAFGFLHAIFIIIHRLTKAPNRSIMKKIFGEGKPRKVADILLTFCLWSFTGLFFFSDSVQKSLGMISGLLSWKSEDFQLIIEMPNFKITELMIVTFGSVILIFSEFINAKELNNPFDNIKTKKIRWGLYLMMIFSLILFGHQINNQFFYFQV